MSRDDLIYIAGFFDGEGCIGLYPNGKRTSYSLRVQLTQNSSPEVDSLFVTLKSCFGGSVSEQVTATERVKLNWQLSGKSAERFLTEVLSFLRLKKEQAVVAVRWSSTRQPPLRGDNGRILPFETNVFMRDTQVARKLKELKRV